ncbi:hypothetical protein [Gemmiger sp. An50]|uniref:hypothetical protein n=1 Tax=Gemmiger sp. An50 TaxID=1965639 RepID=UPI000B3A0B46|nr:hypothetical protein [Gemmiger sp. An50]OUN84932.1 hypothetical protein B5G03_11050 [Gemmiger sp. An50]
MGFFKRLISIVLGIAAGAVAYKLLNDYNKSSHIEGEYVEVPTEPEQPAQAEPEKAASEEPQPEPTVYPQRPDRGPNTNPVTLGAAEKPLDENGKLDPTRIASAEDFGDWDDLGCQG